MAETQLRSETAGSSARSMVHQRTIRTKKPAARARTPSASGPGVAALSTVTIELQSTRPKASQRNAAASTKPATVRR